ncbi:MAG: alanine:cation symporter family protein, partial [Bacteroidales bacterium]|nr:alanine:cation symporter family protein [Bacteroidales bacterium]
MTISDILISVANFVCGYPLFFVLIGGGLFLFFYSGFVSIKKFPTALKVLASRGGSSGQGQISPFQALMSEISSTVGMGNIAGVAIAVTMGGPGSIFWMWVSAIVGMSTKFFEGTLAIMFKGKDSAGEVQGGPMYVMMGGLGPKWKPMAYFFTVSALLGTLCVMQANQLVEAVTSVITTPMGIENTLFLRFLMGLAISVIVGSVIIGGIRRIANIASKIVPLMVLLY